MIKFLKKLFKLIMSRGFIITLLLLLQFLIFFYLAWDLGKRGIYYYYVFEGLGIIFAVSILNRSFNPAYKISWLLVVLIIPFAGPIFYLLFGKRHFSKKQLRKMQKLHEDTMSQFKKFYREHELDNPDIEKISHYITSVTGLTGWKNTDSKLLTPGEKFFEVFLEELEKAERFIFLEYFILEDGYMWSKILEILAAKAKAGVDVRLIYDDFANINRLKYNFKA
ncbi:MAG: PLDc N-terminal domain-containing protein, partial [Bacilli bacterium]|nr:PLDc N-terminal domain-containing protein [Bacilli bacterium]